MSRESTDRHVSPRIRVRGGLLVLLDVVAVAMSLFLAYWLRFDGAIPASYASTMLYSIPLAVLLKVPTLAILRAYRFSWKHVGIRELASTVTACVIGSSALAAAFFLLREVHVFEAVPRSVLAIDLVLCVIGVSGVRLSGRLLTMLRAGGQSAEARRNAKRALIVGAGDAGTTLARSLLEEATSPYLPVGFLDDDRSKWGLIIHGVRVIGGRRLLKSTAESLGAEAVLIAIPSEGGPLIGDTVARIREAGIHDVRILPPLSQLYGASVGAQELREVTPEDLLRRNPVQIDTTAIERLVRDRSVLITGAAGSIGSELCRQVLRFGVSGLVCLDYDETGLFHLERNLAPRFPNAQITYAIGDVRDRSRLGQIMAASSPQIVFHAAAYKHVPLMEQAPAEAVKTNVFGTQCVVEAATDAGVECFVLISTDKAVNPCSTMGVTKRVAELIVRSKQDRSETRYVAVRFGNVLGSRGSVLPIFEEQIRHGGPVTITDPKMRRYFMVTSEAVLLVMQAAAMGEGGEVFVLDMGEPVSILELARDLIRSHGLEPDQDIPIVFTGARPGERLFEELLTAEEGTDTTTNEKVFVARLGSHWEHDDLAERLERLRQAATNGRRGEIIERLCDLVPSYTPSPAADES